MSLVRIEPLGAGVIRAWCWRVPACSNALVPELLGDFLAALREVGQSPDCAAVVLAADGPAFSIGGDMRRFQRERSGRSAGLFLGPGRQAERGHPGAGRPAATGGGRRAWRRHGRLDRPGAGRRPGLPRPGGCFQGPLRHGRLRSRRRLDRAGRPPRRAAPGGFRAAAQSHHPRRRRRLPGAWPTKWLRPGNCRRPPPPPRARSPPIPPAPCVPRKPCCAQGS
jgi:hypothetical protein